MWKIWHWSTLFSWETGHFPASYHSDKAAQSFIIRLW